MTAVSFTQIAWGQYMYWQAQDRKIQKKINGFIRECQRHPFEGTGKPEPLKGDLAGFWSRRITYEHRFVYKATAAGITIVSCRFHY